MYARLEENVVVEMCQLDPYKVYLYEFHAKKFIECPPTVKSGDVYDPNTGEYSTPEKIIDRNSLVVTMRQARLALLAEGILSTVNDAIAAMDSPAKEAAEITWEYATEVKRLDPLVIQLGSFLELSEEQLDNLFVVAATL